MDIMNVFINLHINRNKQIEQKRSREKRKKGKKKAASKTDTNKGRRQGQDEKWEKERNYRAGISTKAISHIRGLNNCHASTGGGDWGSDATPCRKKTQMNNTKKRMNHKNVRNNGQFFFLKKKQTWRLTERENCWKRKKKAERKQKTEMKERGDKENRNERKKR
jgi:hypothetical protein